MIVSGFPGVLLVFFSGHSSGARALLARGPQLVSHVRRRKKDMQRAH